MLRLAFCIAALTCLNLAGCGASQPRGPTYDEALQMYEAEQRTYDRLDKEADDLVIQDTRNTMARTERNNEDRGSIDPNQSESEYAKKLAEIEATSAKERADEMLIFKARLRKAKAARDAQTVKLDAAKKVVDAMSKSK
jgi:DNA-directed RNA polymerase subunit F